MSGPNPKWRFFSQLCTCFIPNAFLIFVGESDEEKQAWREKVALCFVMLFANLGFLGFGGLIHLLSCDVQEQEEAWDAYSYEDETILDSVVDPLIDSVNHEDPVCRVLNVVMVAIMIIIVLILAVQCLCSLIYLIRVGRWCCKAVHGKKCKDAKVIVMVPCYSESEEELRKTIESVRDEDYPSENKLLLFVADGNVLGKNSDGEKNWDTTPQILSYLLDYDRSNNDPMYNCDSTGFNEHGTAIGNRAKVYAGRNGDLKYMVIEKCGLPENEDIGNRGKRDSQVMLLQLLNKIYHNNTLPQGCPRRRNLNELERAVERALGDLDFPFISGIDNEAVKYLMAVDADTRLGKDSITEMVYSMESKQNTLALCGETKVDNKNDSWVTKIQVFEYYTSHHLKKAFESVFGTVTCLPGCFTMYRLLDNSNKPLFACDFVYNRYAINDSKVKTLHEKNLYKLGEDRMLTTLLLQKFPTLKLKYVPEAVCYTIVPDTFSVLLSQRRRWINSTFHNMLYLLGVGLGGMCCCSMKFIVILDIIGTLILPSTLLYFGVMLYNAVIGDSQLPMITLLVFAFSVFVQLIAPLLRLKFKYLLSALVYYVVGVPVFYLVLPLYSFWHLDDFSWGSSCQVAESSTTTNDSNVETVVGEPDEEQDQTVGQHTRRVLQKN